MALGFVTSVLDSYPDLAWWQLDCWWGMRHDLQLAVVNLLGMIDLDTF